MCADALARRTVTPALMAALALGCSPPANDRQDCPAPRVVATAPACPPPGGPAPQEAAALCGCQRCGSARLVAVDAGDAAGAGVGAGALVAAAVAYDAGGSLALRFCADCGQVQGRFPLVAACGVLHLWPARSATCSWFAHAMAGT